MVAISGTSVTLQNVCERYKEKLRTEEINKELLGTDETGRASWHWTAEWGNSVILKRVWECAKEKLTTFEINKYLLGTDKTGSTARHWAADWGKWRHYNKYGIVLKKK